MHKPVRDHSSSGSAEHITHTQALEDLTPNNRLFRFVALPLPCCVSCGTYQNVHGIYSYGIHFIDITWYAFGWKISKAS